MESKEKETGRVRKVLFCTDFSENAAFAFSFAVDALMRSPGAELLILHVVPEPEAQFWKTYLYEIEDIDNKAKHDIDAVMQQKYLARLPSGINSRILYRVGAAAAEILECAREENVDLLVIGRQGSGALQKVLFGNVAEKVIRKADCAVLVIPLSYERRLNSQMSGA